MTSAPIYGALHGSKLPRIKRPPYAREVMTALRMGEPMNVHMHGGPTAWDRAADTAK
jgi:hypothetical protein